MTDDFGFNHRKHCVVLNDKKCLDISWKIMFLNIWPLKVLKRTILIFFRLKNALWQRISCSLHEVSTKTTPTFVIFSLEIAVYSQTLSMSFLGPRGPLVLPTVGPSRPVRPVPCARKIWITIYRHICLMNHEKTHQTNPMAPWDPLDALLTPWDPLATPQSTPSDP